MGAQSIFGGLPISDSDEAGKEWLAESKARYMTDAAFHARVHGVHQAMVAAFINAPEIGHLAVALNLDDKICKASDIPRTAT